jgi:hypothetical protein
VVRFESKQLVVRDHEPEDLEPYCEMESDRGRGLATEAGKAFIGGCEAAATTSRSGTTTSYSLRSALTGSTRNAASAGTMLAMPAMASKTAAAAPKASASKALTP